MADVSLTQSEADALCNTEKVRVDDSMWLFPRPGERISIPLTSANKREFFNLDVTRSSIVLEKATYQNRARQIVILVRLDINSRPHRNPDNQEMPGSHLHLYREGYHDKWAFPVPEDKFLNVSDLYETLQPCTKHCNILCGSVISFNLQILRECCFDDR